MRIPLYTFLEDKVAEHFALHSRFMLGDDSYTPEQIAAIPAAHWPVVRSNPATGRKHLFIGVHARSIEGMTVPEGRISMVLIAAERLLRPAAWVLRGFFFGAATATACISLLAWERLPVFSFTAGRLLVAADRLPRRGDGRRGCRDCEEMRVGCVRSDRAGGISSPVRRSYKSIPLADTICRNSIDFQ